MHFDKLKTPCDLSRLYRNFVIKCKSHGIPTHEGGGVEREKKKSLGRWNLAAALESREKEARTETRSVGRRNLTVSPSSPPLLLHPRNVTPLRDPLSPFPLDSLDCLPSLASSHSCVRTRVAFARSKIANRMYSYRRNFISMTGARSIRVASAIPLIHVGLSIYWKCIGISWIVTARIQARSNSGEKCQVCNNL